MSKLSRRSLVASAAALPALAVPAIAITSVEPDPIYAAIERWKEAVAVEDEAFRAHGDGDETATDARIEAMHDIFNTMPTTMDGMRAKIDFAMSVDDVTDCLRYSESAEPLGNFLQTLYASAWLIAGQSASASV
jgi:hypothetical protein